MANPYNNGKSALDVLMGQEKEGMMSEMEGGYPNLTLWLEQNEMVDGKPKHTAWHLFLLDGLYAFIFFTLLSMGIGFNDFIRTSLIDSDPVSYLVAAPASMILDGLLLFGLTLLLGSHYCDVTWLASFCLKLLHFDGLKFAAMIVVGGLGILGAWLGSYVATVAFDQKSLPIPSDFYLYPDSIGRIMLLSFFANFILIWAYLHLHRLSFYKKSAFIAVIYTFCKAIFGFTIGDPVSFILYIGINLTKLVAYDTPDAFINGWAYVGSYLIGALVAAIGNTFILRPFPKSKKEYEESVKKYQ